MRSYAERRNEDVYGTYIVQHRPTLPIRAVLIAALLLSTNLEMLAGQDPFPQVPPGYYPNGQYPNAPPSNGTYPYNGYNQGPRIPTQPVQQEATFGGPASPDGPNGIRIQQAKPFVPLYQRGQPSPNGAVPATYLGPAGVGQTIAPPRPAALCKWALTLARVGNDVVLTGDLPNGVDDMMSRAGSRIPPEKVAQQRAALVKEINNGIDEFATHVAAGDADPAKGMSDSRRMLLYQMVRQQTDVKLIYHDFRKTVPKEGYDQIIERVNKHFDDTQLKSLMKREKVTSLADLENALRAKGSSVDRERRNFQEQFIAQQWAQQKIKPEEDHSEITHQDMLDWYNAHIKEFEQQPRVRWEELMVSFSRHPNHDEARAVLATLGNRVLAGADFSEVARSASDGATAHQGGRWDWTHRDSLDCTTINDAIFSLPVAQLSPILEAADGYHIVRVVERQELTRTSFLDAQKKVKEKIEKERFEERYQEFVKDLRAKYPIWTVFDASMQPANNPDDDDRYSGR